MSSQSGAWACAACTFVNENPAILACEVCWSPRRTAASPTTATATTPSASAATVAKLPPSAAAASAAKAASKPGCTSSNSSSSGDSTDSTCTATNSHSSASEDGGMVPPVIARSADNRNGSGSGNRNNERQQHTRQSRRSSQRQSNPDLLFVDDADDENMHDSLLLSGKRNVKRDSLHTATKQANDQDYSYFYSMQQETLRRSQVAHTAKTKASKKTTTLNSFAQSASTILLDPKTLQSLLAKQEYCNRVVGGGEEAATVNARAHADDDAVADNNGNDDFDAEDDLAMQRILAQQYDESGGDLDSFLASSETNKGKENRKNTHSFTPTSSVQVPFSFKVAILLVLSLVAYYLSTSALSDLVVLKQQHQQTEQLPSGEESNNIDTNDIMTTTQTYNIGLFGFSTPEMKSTPSNISSQRPRYLPYTLSQSNHFMHAAWKLAQLWYRHATRFAAFYVVIPSIILLAVAYRGRSAANNNKTRTMNAILMTILCMLSIGPILYMTVVFQSSLCSSSGETQLQLNYQTILTDVEMDLGYAEDDDDSVLRTMYLYYATDVSSTGEENTTMTTQCEVSSYWILASSLLWMLVSIGTQVWIFGGFSSCRRRGGQGSDRAVIPSDDQSDDDEKHHHDNKVVEEETEPTDQEYAADGLELLFEKPKRLFNILCVSSVVVFFMSIPRQWIINGAIVSTGYSDNDDNDDKITQIFGRNSMNPHSQDVIYSDEQRSIVQHVYGSRVVAWMPSILMLVCVIILLKARFVLWYQHFEQTIRQQQQERQQMNRLLSVWFFPVAHDDNNDNTNDTTSPFQNIISTTTINMISRLYILIGIWILSVIIAIQYRASQTLNGKEFQFDELIDYNMTNVTMTTVLDDDTTTNETTIETFFASFESEDSVPSSFWIGTNIISLESTTTCHPTQYMILWLLSGIMILFLCSYYGYQFSFAVQESYNTLNELYPSKKDDKQESKPTILNYFFNLFTISLSSSKETDEATSVAHQVKKNTNSAEIDRTPINIVV